MSADTFETGLYQQGFNAAFEWEFFEPVRPGDKITAKSKLVDLYEKQGRRGKLLFAISETTHINQKGQVVGIKRGTVMHVRESKLGMYGPPEKDIAGPLLPRPSDQIQFDKNNVLGFPIDVRKIKCPYGKPGDTLWVREAWGVCNGMDDYKPSEIPEGLPIIYREESAYPNDPSMKWRPSIFMPRWASRINLLVKSIKVERIQKINMHDAVCEGLLGGGKLDAIHKFEILWNTINKKRGYGWDMNYNLKFCKIDKLKG